VVADGLGRVYVFTKRAARWKLAVKLPAPIYEPPPVAISGTTVVVGVYGAKHAVGRVYLYTLTEAGLKPIAVLQGVGTWPGDDFGWSVAISGGTIVVGAPGKADGAGRAYVFTRTDAGWKQVAVLKGRGTVAGDEFGGGFTNSSVAVRQHGCRGRAGRAVRSRARLRVHEDRCRLEAGCGARSLRKRSR
jgi:hypothetical protein